MVSPSRPRSSAVCTLGTWISGVGRTWLEPGGTTQIVPSRSAISIRPSGVQAICVGSSRPMITRSLTNTGAPPPSLPLPPTVTLTGADAVRLPAASRATAVRVWVPDVAVVVSQVAL